MPRDRKNPAAKFAAGKRLPVLRQAQKHVLERVLGQLAREASAHDDLRAIGEDTFLVPLVEQQKGGIVARLIAQKECFVRFGSSSRDRFRIVNVLSSTPASGFRPSRVQKFAVRAAVRRATRRASGE